VKWLGVFTMLLVSAGAGAAEPTHWTPPAITTAQFESTPTFSPDGKEMFFFRGDQTFSRYRLFHSHCVDGRWSDAAIPPFASSSSIDEADPSFTADGRRLYFVSSRGDPRPREQADLDIWFVDRADDGHWGEPVQLPEPVNSGASELLPRPQADGSLVFGSDRAGGLGQSDIYRAYPDGHGWRVENLGSPVNSKFSEYEADLSRDGKTLIVVADRGDRSHLYPYRREGAAWVAQPRIVPRLDVFQVGPLLSPDAGRLLFAQADRENSGELFLLDLVPVHELTSADRLWPFSCRRSPSTHQASP
jgi:Tol biopolymer transport system component